MHGNKTLFDLDGRVALVTGGSRGLGLQVAEALGDYGATIAISARKQHELDAALEHLRARGIRAEAFAADASKPEAVTRLVDDVAGNAFKAVIPRPTSSTGGPTVTAEPTRRRVSPAARRARQMMIGGLALGHGVGIAVIGLALAIGGADAALTAALGFAAVVIFYSIGQSLEVVACELPDMQGMGLVLVSYAVRVVGIAAGLWAILSLPAMEGRVQDGWLLLSVAGTVIGWVTGVVLVASRQRVPVYDTEYQPPPSHD